MRKTDIIFFRGWVCVEVQIAVQNPMPDMGGKMNCEYFGDYNELLYLRARQYAPSIGRFLTRDTWAGNTNVPMSFNRWNYVGGNPVNLTDPSGNFPPLWCQFMPNKALYEGCVDLWYGIEPIHYTMLGEYVTGGRGCYQGPSEYRAPGYIEGTGLTIASPSIANWLFAIESVYDFATMEHDYYINGSFDIPGIPGVGVSDFVWGGVASQYSGYVYGFRTTARSINDEYPGAAFLGFLGISVGTTTATSEGIGFGYGHSAFVSVDDPTIRGTTIYNSISLGFELPIPLIDAGLGMIKMKSATNGHPQSYIENNKVKAMNLYLDILLGRHSVWLTDLKTVPAVLALNTRYPAANKALKYATAYRELK